MSHEQSLSEAGSWVLPHPDARWRYFLTSRTQPQCLPQCESILLQT